MPALVVLVLQLSVLQLVNNNKKITMNQPQSRKFSLCFLYSNITVFWNNICRYSFTYETTDEYGVTLTRSESGDASGNVKGSYMYRDANGIYRTVEYGDNGGGFQASVQSNEPGLVSHKAADAEYIVQN